MILLVGLIIIALIGQAIGGKTATWTLWMLGILLVVAIFTLVRKGLST